VVYLQEEIMSEYKARVVPGAGRGKKIGFPTLNLEIPEDFDYDHGIYEGWVVMGDKRHKGAFHYGPIPSFDNKNTSLEVFVLDIDLKESPEFVVFSLVKFIRKIRKFASTEELAQQIKEDIKKING
jgi:riboflavin kinase / FMN adenylyltransferase